MCALIPTAALFSPLYLPVSVLTLWASIEGLLWQSSPLALTRPSETQHIVRRGTTVHWHAARGVVVRADFLANRRDLLCWVVPPASFDSACDAICLTSMNEWRSGAWSSRCV